MTCERISKREDHLGHLIGLLLSSWQSLSTEKIIKFKSKNETIVLKIRPQLPGGQGPTECGFGLPTLNPYD
jgi:hypothetical protein